MNEFLSEGPKEIKISNSETILSCAGCSNLKSSLWRSGKNPVYQKKCTLTGDTIVSNKFEIHHSNSRHVEFAEYSMTPSTCPLIKNLVRSSKIEEILK